MAKPAKRGLPSDFTLDLPDEKPVVIGDFLDEKLPLPVARKPQKAPEATLSGPPSAAVEQRFRPEIVRERSAGQGRRSHTDAG